MSATPADTAARRTAGLVEVSALDAEPMLQDLDARLVGDLAALEETLRSHVEELATRLARGTQGDTLDPDAIAIETEAYLAGARDHIEEFSVRVGSHLGASTKPLFDALLRSWAPEWQHHLDGIAARGQGELRRWRERQEALLQEVDAYVLGFIYGGGVAYTIYMALPPEEYGDPVAVARVLHPRLAGFAERVRAALQQFIGELAEQLPALIRDLRSQMRRVAAELGEPEKAGRKKRDGTPASAAQQRLARLLSVAEDNGITVRKVPARPSGRWLDQLESRLERVLEERKADQQRAEKLQRMLAFAVVLKARIKDVPAKPSDGWLDELARRLSKVAQRRGEEVPDFDAQPDDGDETRFVRPAADPLRDQRVARMLRRAKKAGVGLGRVPSNPSLEWIEATEEKLEKTLAERKAERRAAREREAQARKKRLTSLLRRAKEAGVELGAVPPFPTADWLGRAEGRIVTANENARSQPNKERHERLMSIAAERGLELASPPDPDEAWLDAAEAQLAEPPEDPGLAEVTEIKNNARAVLIYEEGTVQETIWPFQGVRMTIGRGRGCDVQVLEDPSVSRNHCTITQEGGQFFIADNGSTKGTWVEDERVSDVQKLEGGEQIELGASTFTFRVHG